MINDDKNEHDRNMLLFLKARVPYKFLLILLLLASIQLSS